MNISNTPSPPYFAIIFTTIKNKSSEYELVANQMIELVQKQDGFLGFESAEEKVGITISYWKDLASIQNWKNNLDHQEAQKKGKSKFYKAFKVRICKVERDYQFGNIV